MATPEQNGQVIDALVLWAQGNQAEALTRVQPLADANVPAATLALAWFLVQLGEPRWREGVPYALRAVEMGMPQIANNYWPQMINDPSFRQQGLEMLRALQRAGWPLDPLGNIFQVAQAGDRGAALSMLDIATEPRPFPRAWADLLERAQSEAGSITAAAEQVSSKRDAVLEALDSDAEVVAETRANVETRAQQLLQLIQQITNAQAQSFFDEEATKYEHEGSVLWRWGLGVLAAASLVAILPLLIYYSARALGKHPWLHGHDLFAAHATPAVALGAVAGVLLARSRGRDRARQRARDLSVALATMFVYSGQIADEGERQRFMHDMGRTVIEAFLRQESPSQDTDSAGLLNALRRA